MLSALGGGYRGCGAGLSIATPDNSLLVCGREWSRVKYGSDGDSMSLRHVWCAKNVGWVRALDSSTWELHGLYSCIYLRALKSLAYSLQAMNA